ncbi:MAG: hypothetical protein JWN94_3507 [Betaproteobacteria bacterium]|nr:hypothetical protein [Betaproteobacteria bacterium]
MINNLFSRSPLHQHADSAQRALGVAELQPDSEDIARLLTGDPAPEVRIAAAKRCTDAAKLVAAWHNESDDAVRAALAEALAETLDATRDSSQRDTMLGHITSEDLLVEMALGAGHADTRKAAAARVASSAGLHKLVDAAKSKDRGIVRLAQQRIDAMTNHAAQVTEADSILAQLLELATRNGPILSAVVELDRRWHALDTREDTARAEQYKSARDTVQARFAREQEEQRSRSQLERTVHDWVEKLAAPADTAGITVLREQFAVLKDAATERSNAAALSQLEQAEQRIAGFEHNLESFAGVEALVLEAERLAADTTVDDAQLPTRWQAIDRKLRTPELTQRFETALILVEQRRLAFLETTRQQTQAVRQQVHALLHSAEQALAAGQLQVARTAADNVKKLKLAAGLLPKPTTQRLGRLMQQLVELERWESFGQQNARVQLCERAEALTAQTMDPPQVAVEVQKLRNEWKALDQQHSGVPKALWDRFNNACEKAYAPAARFFSEQAAQRKQGRKQREEFIAAAGAHAPTLLTEPRDWRAIERWLRETETKWREGNLGSVEPRAWKKLDTELKAALAPLRDALGAARDEAKAARIAMIDEAKSLADKAMERDTLNQVKALQARWQEHAKQLSLLQRDERTLWDQFRAACDAIFKARDAKRKEQGDAKHQGRRALEEIGAQLEALAAATDKSDQEIRKAARDLGDQWRKLRGGPDPALRGVEVRFKKAQTAVDAMLAERARAQKAAVWTTLASKEQLCEELDGLVRAGNAAADAATAPSEKWNALPELPADWEKKLRTRRDAAVGALAETAVADTYRQRIEAGSEVRRERLLELEIALSLDSPPEFQQQRLALQVKQLRDRFKNAAATGADTAAERLVAWCAEPGIADAEDRRRSERIFKKVSAKA